MTTQHNNACLADFLDFMNRKGLNTTSQRRIIAEAFFELPGHHSLEEFYQHILQRDPGIGQTTVYRTLKLLCDAGMAMEIHFSDGITRDSGDVLIELMEFAIQWRKANGLPTTAK